MEEAQRKITDYYKNDKKLLQETTTRQDTQQDKELMKDTRTRQEIQDKALLHRRTTPGHRKSKPKTKQECGDYNRRITHDVQGEDEDWSGPYTDDSESDDSESEYDEGDSEKHAW
jgi:hypothetical protein